MGDDLRCPVCGSTELQNNGDIVTCAQCGTEIELPTWVCPECGATNQPGTSICSYCGHAFDLVGSVIHTRLMTPAARLELVRQRAGTLKQEAEAASEERMRRMWEEEEERRARLAQARAERARQEQRMLIGTIIFAAVMFLCVLLYVLLR